MFATFFPQLVNLFSFLVLGAAILLILRGSLDAQVDMFTLQSFTLALLTAIVAWYAASADLFGVAVVLVILKVVIIPRVLNRAVTNIGLQRAAAPYLGTAPALVVCGALIVVAFYVMTPLVASNPLPTANALPLAFAGVLVGLFVTVNRKRALTQILGFLMMENSIFLLALLATYGVPFIIEVGVFLDVLVAVLIFEVFVYHIKENFDTLEVGQMGELKG
jgi:hydrogenase-4 component E